MKLHVLGSAGYHANDWRQTTCLMIPELGIVLDAGTSFYRVRQLLDEVPGGTISVLLSHAHIDHIIGLTQAINVFWGSEKQMQICGYKDHLDTVEQLFDSGMFPVAMDSPVMHVSPHAHGRWVECLPQRMTFEREALPDPLHINLEPLPHPGTSLGYRLRLDDGDLVYITDTSASAVPLEFARGAKTLVHECNFPDGWEAQAKLTGHSYTSEVIELARRAGVEQLVLMHWNPFPEQEAGYFIQNMSGLDLSQQLPFKLILAEDNMIIDI